MIDIVAVIVVLALAGLGSRWLSKDIESDRHSQFCIGLCTHIEENEAPSDPNDPETEEAMTVIVGPAIVDHAPKEVK
jgi:hypothetical protein